MVNSAQSKVPTFKQLMNPALNSLSVLGGSATVRDLLQQVIQDLGLPEEVTEVLHSGGPMTELDYRLHWTRTYLKHAELINNSSRGVWSLTDSGRQTESVDPDEIVRKYMAERKKMRGREETMTGEAVPSADDPPPDTDDWQQSLLRVLNGMSPAGFERLCRQMLRESGFFEVAGTGGPGDQGIDGTGVIRREGLISFAIAFQCKRWQGSVGPSVVREFRGAMQGKADRGMIITTAVFTREAQREATRTVPPIDLVDGELLIAKLKEFNLGITTKMVEDVEIDPDWFATR